MSISGGKQKSSSSSSSFSQAWDYGTDVNAIQSPYLADLYTRAQGNLGVGNGAQPYLDQATGALGAGNEALTQSNAALQRLMNPNQDPALSAYATNLGQQFNEQFLPGLKGDAALAGGLGGSRQQIGAALGAQRAMQTLGDFTAQTYAGNQDRALQAATALGGNAQAQQGNASIYGQLAEFAQGMPWFNLNQYAGLLGPAITQDLGSYSTSSSTSKGKSGGMSGSFGLGGGGWPVY